ncbi:flagellar brake protein [Clostridium mediterraneense]|uniref:flagellar brake protein n=1 Tax=Clostridium mediterraneense TaxID=1805472 RepID=UPI00082AF1B7|nr:PilZ domain-containing protein [Clostridium mediterraneense]
MKRFKLEVNNNIEIYEDDKVYKSRIQSVNDDEIYIDIPLHNNEYLILNKGDDIHLIKYGNEGSVYELSCKVIDRKIEGNIRLYRLSEPYDIKKIQRRNYVRVETIRGIKCFRKDEEFNALILDLSGGGMKIKSNKKLEIDEEIVSFVKTDDGKFMVKGKIIRVEETSFNQYSLGIEFVDIEERTREKIIKLVFSIMRKQMELI